MDTVSSLLARSGGALDATLSLGAVNISVHRVTGGAGGSELPLSSPCAKQTLQ